MTFTKVILPHPYNLRVLLRSWYLYAVSSRLADFFSWSPPQRLPSFYCVKPAWHAYTSAFLDRASCSSDSIQNIMGHRHFLRGHHTWKHWRSKQEKVLFLSIHGSLIKPRLIYNKVGAVWNAASWSQGCLDSVEMLPESLSNTRIISYFLSHTFSSISLSLSFA